jgi:hypothetical protein
VTEGARVDRGRWTTAAVVVVTLFVAIWSLLLALYFFFGAIFLNIGYHGDAPSAIRDTTNLLMVTSLAYLFATGAVNFSRGSRTPTPFLVASILLVVAAVLGVQAHLQRLSYKSPLPPWFLPIGVATALLALAAAWLRHRPSTPVAIATLIATAGMCMAIVLFTARS